jgi:fucose permease
MIGIGMTLLQVAINPMLRVAGGEEHFAFNSVIGQLVFGSASFISPQVYSYLVTHLGDYQGGGNFVLEILAPRVPDDLPWVSLYWVFALVALVMIVVILVARLPKFELKDEERAGAWSTHKELLRNPAVILYFVGIFCYVGSEQGVANWMSQFLETYHGYNPQVEGAQVVAWFWGLLTAGCLLGLVLIKLFDCRKVLVGFSSAAILALTFALFGDAKVSYAAFMLVGFSLSVMWSIIFSLALNSVARHHGSFSGLLCTGIVGGAIVSLLVGWLGDQFGLRAGMTVLYITLGYILSIGIWAKPLVNNATISLPDLVRRMHRSTSR